MTLDRLLYLVLLAVAIRLIARFVAAVVAEVNRQLTTMPCPNCGTQMPCKTPARHAAMMSWAIANARSAGPNPRAGGPGSGWATDG
jgi:hypothetical protein